jgi:hypothetical protein
MDWGDYTSVAIKVCPAVTVSGDADPRLDGFFPLVSDLSAGQIIYISIY